MDASMCPSTTVVPGELDRAQREREPILVCPAPSFERRRAIASARERLFGVPSALRIGRFRVEGRLGVGAMGEVFLAVDEELERTVALKLMLPTASGDGAGVPSRERLRREARALARLSHPNVVQVYELGVHEGWTFLAMEHVDGRTLRQWLASEARAWPQVLRCFVDAGRGLAAAHRAGVIHRDFKPDNVLIGRDGRARVADFGLAMAESEAVTTAPGDGASLPWAQTSTGAVLGTVRYMPLEQLRGRSVDERSDQFAFCVALYEALWGAEPFEGRSASSRIEALEDGRVAEPHGGAPGFVWRAVRRGLARDPDDRWPDMDALLRALGDRRGARAIAGLVGIGVVAVAAAGWRAASPSPEPISSPAEAALCDRAVPGPWPPARRQALSARFGRSPEPHAADSGMRVRARLDRWAASWEQQRDRACDRRRSPTVDPELVRAAAVCLHAQRTHVEILVDLLLEDDEGTAGDPLVGAVDATHELPSPTWCDDESELRNTTPPVESEAEGLEALAVLSRARLLRLLARFDEALPVSSEALARADALGYEPLVAEAMAERTRLDFELDIDRVTSSFFGAVERAERARHERLALELRTQGTIFVARELRSGPAARVHLEVAEVIAAQRGAEPHELGRLALARGMVLALDEGSEAEARVQLQRALEHLGDEDVPLRVTIHDTAAQLLGPLGSAEAEAEAELALAAAERVWGARHPRTAASRERLVTVRRGLAEQGSRTSTEELGHLPADDHL